MQGGGTLGTSVDKGAELLHEVDDIAAGGLSTPVNDAACVAAADGAVSCGEMTRLTGAAIGGENDDVDMQQQGGGDYDYYNDPGAQGGCAEDVAAEWESEPQRGKASGAAAKVAGPQHNSSDALSLSMRESSDDGASKDAAPVSAAASAEEAEAEAAVDHDRVVQSGSMEDSLIEEVAKPQRGQASYNVAAFAVAQGGHITPAVTAAAAAASAATAYPSFSALLSPHVVSRE